MKLYGLVLPLVLAVACTGTFAEDAAKDATKHGDGKKPVVGTLSEKPADSKVENLAAVLTTKDGKKINLIAAGDIATKLAELAKAGKKAVIFGEVSADGSSINVTKVREPGDHPEKGDHKKKKDAGQ